MAIIMVVHANRSDYSYNSCKAINEPINII